MKRSILLLLLSIAVLICLSACKGTEMGGTAAPDASAVPSAGNTGEGMRLPAPGENYVAKITVQINPAFEIYVDDQGKVLTVNFANADAQEVGKDLSFENLSVQETIRQLLQASNEKGYFAQEARPVEIRIEQFAATMPEGMSDTLRLSALQTVVAFTDEENVELELRLKMGEQTAVDTVIKDGKAEELPEEISVDTEAGTTTETITFDNGATCIKTYDAQCWLISEKTNYPGLYIVEKCFENGVLTKEIMDTAEGNHTVTYYWPNGEEKATEHQGADGRVFNCEYNESGVMTWAYEVMPGGGALEQEYRADGTLLRSIDTFPDGTIERTYDEQGNIVLEVTDRADDQSRAEYTYNGTTLSSTVIYIQNGGSLEKLVMEYSGATQTSTEYYRGGGKIIRKYDGDGNMLSEVFYDAAGNIYDNVDEWSAHMNWE